MIRRALLQVKKKNQEWIVSWIKSKSRTNIEEKVTENNQWK